MPHRTALGVSEIKDYRLLFKGSKTGAYATIETKKGCRVELVRMDDPYRKFNTGEQGTVTGVDDIGTIHVAWDCGSSLGIAYGVDECRRIPTVKSRIFMRRTHWMRLKKMSGRC